MTEIQLTVQGWPPKKSEALSMFSKTHKDSHLVRVLLLEMKKVLNRESWDQLEERKVGLELILVEAPSKSLDGDATNYLGGVADVLQANRTNIDKTDTSHISDLLELSIYRNDKQIREVRYWVESGDTCGYCVRVWTL